MTRSIYESVLLQLFVIVLYQQYCNTYNHFCKKLVILQMGITRANKFGILISNQLMYICDSHCHKNSNRNLISLRSSTLSHQAWFLYRKQAKVASSYVGFVTQYVIQIYHIPQQFHYHDMSIFDHHSRESDYM